MIIDEIKKLVKANDASCIIVSDNIELAKYIKCDKYKLEFGELSHIED